MAKWVLGLNSKNNAITSTADYSDKDYVDFTITQHNTDAIMKEVQRDRDILAAEKKVSSCRKASTVPDIVAIEILQKYGLDLHEPTFMSDKGKMDKLKYVVKTEYPHLLISTQESVMAKYVEMIQKVRNWANRDNAVLSDATIEEMLRYGADDVYRTLRIAPLEALKAYTISVSAGEAKNSLTIPSDLIEPIQLRKRDTQIGSGTNSIYSYNVYSHKSDIQTFNEDVFHYGAYHYTRQQGNFLLGNEFQDGEVYELLYYRRLADLDAVYTVTPTNNSASNLLYHATRAGLLSLFNTEMGNTAETNVADYVDTSPRFTNNIVEVTSSNNGAGQTYVGMTAGFYIGKESPNWLRDSNEKVVLFAALKQTFDFLNDIEGQQVYAAKAAEEVFQLNKEDQARNNSGGTVQTSFYSNLI